MSPGLKAPLRRRGVVGRGRGEGRGGVGRWGEGGRVGGNGKCWFFPGESSSNYPQTILKSFYIYQKIIPKTYKNHHHNIILFSSNHHSRHPPSFLFYQQIIKKSSTLVSAESHSTVGPGPRCQGSITSRVYDGSRLGGKMR